jgi:hypothetical protein
LALMNNYWVPDAKCFMKMILLPPPTQWGGYFADERLRLRMDDAHALEVEASGAHRFSPDLREWERLNKSHFSTNSGSIWHFGTNSSPYPNSGWKRHWGGRVVARW